MRVLFCTTGGLGHLMPLRPLALALRSRGHQIGWVTAPDARPLLAGDGFELFAAGPTFKDGRRQFRAAHANAAQFAGEHLSAYTYPRLFGAVLGPAMLDGLSAAVTRWRPDFVVHEPAALAVPLVCAQRGLRHVAHGYGLRPPVAYLQEAMRFFGSHWQARGLRPPADGGLYRHLYLDIAPESLQPSPGQSDRVLRFNAYRRVAGKAATSPVDLQAVLARSTAGRPLVYVSFGTVFNRSPALATAAQAAALLGGTVIVTVGLDGDLQRFAGLGQHVHVHRFVDQEALLSNCDAVVSHGGAGTLLGAASHGVPQLVLPQAADHFRNARALSSANAGMAVEPAAQGLDSVLSSLSTVLQSHALHAGAKALAREMTSMSDAGTAAAGLERWQMGAFGDS